MANLIDWIKGLTPARVFSQREGASLSTLDSLTLRADHAFARDAVYPSAEYLKEFLPHFQNKFGLFEVSTKARTRQEYLLNPGLGRSFFPPDRNQILQLGTPSPQVQVFLGDGLSPAAVLKNGFPLLEELFGKMPQNGWSLGRPFFVHQARVGILNEVGELLHPDVAILLIGERPGLSTGESLSSYMAYQPATGHTDAQRNLISNIHSLGLDIQTAAQRIVSLTKAMITSQISGVDLKEQLYFGPQI